MGTRLRIHKLTTKKQASDACAYLVCKQIIDKPSSVLGFATGGTMEPVYKSLVAEYKQRKLSFAESVAFSLDEYVGLAPEHPQSFAYYLQKRLYQHIDIPKQSIYFPKGDIATDDIAQQYQQNLDKYGPIDIQLLGIGVNAHIAFNEPGSDFNSLCRLVQLSTSTLTSNAKYFESNTMQASKGITMGIGSILKAKHIVLLAVGQSKAEAIRDMICNEQSLSCPASALQSHPNVDVLLDKDAASLLS